jgi:REP-associated tyrosine transposase
MENEERLHPGHHSIRLKGRDYSAPGIYFVTICTHDRKCVFGAITEGELQFSLLGRIVRESWVAVPQHFAHTNLHGFVIMPNHLHGLIEIVRQARAQRAAPLQEQASGGDPRPAVRPGSLGAIVRSFKAAVTLRARRELSWIGEIWQSNYFERVVRDGQEFSDAGRYIGENPMKWEWDRENPEAKSTKVGTEVNGAQHATPLQGRGAR